MLDELEKFLLSETERSVDPERLTMIGKQAASEFLSKGTPLNDTVRSLSKEASLNEEQTKRVIEQANVSTFVHMFKGDYNQNIEFPLADYAEISADQSSEETSKVSHYVEPSSYRYVPGQEYVSLENVFGSDGSIEKTADEGWSARDKHDYFELRYRLKHSTSDLTELSDIFEIQFEKLASSMEQHIKDGADQLEVVMLVKEAGIDRSLMEILLEKASAHVSTHAKKTKAYDNDPGLKGGQKTELPDIVQAAILKKKLLKKKLASLREVNTEHPLYKEAVALATLTNKLLLTRDEIKEYVVRAEDSKRPQDLKNIADRVL